ncbi:MAG: hypothetical protein GY805_22010 [Chloroflexi bacterium]|nr:hypothetical protein [Chloroflexota bacterium]
MTHELGVNRYTTTGLTNAEVDSVLADATEVLQTNDGPGDVACDVAFVRDGDVTEFAAGDGSIDSQAEFNAMLGLPGYVAVVNQINWCGGLIPNVIGCAPVPGESMTVVRYFFALDQEGILWAHEFGHTRGLSHRNDDPNAVMNGTIGETHRRVTEEECAAFRTEIGAATASAAGAMAVEDFVRQAFIRGVPYETASGYGATDVPILLEMLNDPVEEAYWANIVVVLNIIGGEEVVEPLISFIDEGVDGELTYSHYIAKTSALMSLGYLINRTGNEQALNYLTETANPEVWVEREVTDIGPFQATVAESNRDLSKHALLGLALSGNPEAAEAMRSLQVAEVAGEQAEFQALVTDVISEALEANREIDEGGLIEYYRTNQP